jgi:hypothetical protein
VYECDCCDDTDHKAEGWRWLKDKGSSVDAIVLCAACVKYFAPKWKAEQEA